MSLRMNLFCLYCSTTLIFLLFLQAVCAQYRFDEVDRLLTERKQQLGNKVVTLIYKDGKMIYQKETGEDFKVETIQPIGASSKWLTAALIMTFVDKGELSLDDPVSRYLPIFSSYSKSYITIRHCLSEITGIESAPKKLNRILQKKKFASLEEEVNYFAATKDIITNPGQELFVGDVGYNIAGRVLEVISKRKTFSRLMQERITRPLTMRRTSFAAENGAEDPSGGAVSTAGEYIKFMTMLLNNGEYNGKRILSKEAIQEMHTAHNSSLPVKGIPRLAEGFQYGYGTWIQEAGKNMIIGAPSLTGTWPYINTCKNYACIVFTPPLAAEQKRDVYTAVQEEIERQISGECK
ncbi:MAG: serine hydrolase [Chitinophagaceae bacterium]